MRPPTLALCLVVCGATACSDVKEDDHGHDHTHGLSTAVVLHFSAPDGSVTSFTWQDPENDGVDVMIDDITLTSGTDYTLELEVLNQLEEPVGDVTAEILEHADEHQFFFTGTEVSGPASDATDPVLTHAYADTDDAGLPLGIDNDIQALRAGSTDLVVTLRHLPAESGEPLKTDGLADDVRTGGMAAIGGDTDIAVTFAVTVD